MLISTQSLILFLIKEPKSPLYTLNDIVTDSAELIIQKNTQAGLNLDLTNPRSYVWYGSASELIRAS